MDCDLLFCAIFLFISRFSAVIITNVFTETIGNNLIYLFTIYLH